LPKAAAAPAPAQKKDGTPSPRGGVGTPHRRDIPRMDSLSGLQHALGNQHILQLLNTHRLQLKSRGASSDPLELEADRAAELVTHRTPSPQVQRKCAGGDDCHCAKCSEDEERRRFQLSSAPNRVQRQAKGKSSTAEAESRDVAGVRAPLGGFLVEDDATELGKGQMKKSAFLVQVTDVVCSTANAELAASGRSANDCPYISKWLAHYRNQSAAHIERALWRYAPEAAHAGSARDYLSVIRRRVRQAVATWAKTGKITGVPPGVPMTPEQGRAGAGTWGEETKPGGVEQTEEEGFGTSLLRTLTGEKRVQFKEQPGGSPDHADPEAIRSQLGSGKGLDSRARSRMETSFGHDFSRVRVHTDSRAEGLSSRLNARAFTIGTDIAFAPGEYRPGTLVGDALIAHELAHVVQQGTASQVQPPTPKSAADCDSLEADADISAVGAAASAWTRGSGKLANIWGNATPRLKSGLRLQRCRRTVKQCPPGLQWAVVGLPAATGPVCVCAWRCLPPGVGYSISGPSGPPGEEVSSWCPEEQRDLAGRCPDDPNFVTVDKDYEKKNYGTKLGVGAHMSPLGEQAACGCLPLDIEGDTTGQQQVHAPLLPPGVDITDVAAPLADVAAAKSGAKPRLDPTTGKPRIDEPTKTPETTEGKPSATVVGPPAQSKSVELSKGIEGQGAEVKSPAPAVKGTAQPPETKSTETKTGEETAPESGTHTTGPPRPSTRLEEPTKAGDLMSPQQRVLADRLDAAETKARNLRNEKLLLESEQRDLVNMPSEKYFKGRRQRMEEIAERLKEIGIELPNAEATSKTAEKNLRDSSLSLYDKLSVAARRGPAYESVVSRAHGIDQVSGLRTKNPTVDHLVSIKKITELPGFDRLSWEDQLATVNMRENLVVMDGSANSSKGANSWEEWPQAKEFYPDVKVRSDMISREKTVLKKIKDTIEGAKKVK
jgi:hypothetical protein